MSVSTFDGIVAGVAELALAAVLIWAGVMGARLLTARYRMNRNRASLYGDAVNTITRVAGEVSAVLDAVVAEILSHPDRYPQFPEQLEGQLLKSHDRVREMERNRNIR